MRGLVVACAGYVAVVAAIVAGLQACGPQTPVVWRGIDRATATCDVDLDNVFAHPDQATCVQGARRYACVRERRVVQCAPVDVAPRAEAQ